MISSRFHIPLKHSLTCEIPDQKIRSLSFPPETHCQWNHRARWRHLHKKKVGESGGVELRNIDRVSGKPIWSNSQGAFLQEPKQGPSSTRTEGAPPSFAREKKAASVDSGSSPNSFRLRLQLVDIQVVTLNFSATTGSSFLLGAVIFDSGEWKRRTSRRLVDWREKTKPVAPKTK